jgi:hypothetical protein
MDPRGGSWGDFGVPLRGFWELWVSFGVILDTSGGQRDHFLRFTPEPRKTKDLLEKRSPGAHGGDQDGIILGVLGPKICPKSTHGPPNVQKGKPRPRQAAAETQGGTQGAHKAPQSRKRRDLGTSAGGPRNPSNPSETPRSPPPLPLGRASSASPSPPESKTLKDSKRDSKTLKSLIEDC